MPSETLDRARLQRCYEQLRDGLLAARNAQGHWEGELSTSALSTATAVMALEMVRRASTARPGGESPSSALLPNLIAGGVAWLAQHQNADGGWGDTCLSFSNISTTMLCHAVFHATGTVEQYPQVVAMAAAYLDKAGGVAALRARYGKDKTFSIPILTHCALAGLVPWREVSPLPFELACIPAQFYKWVRLPVVSYALPALIAIGQVRHHFLKPANPLIRGIRNLAIESSLAKLTRIQPTSGGFLEAVPLTSFVTMSLAGMGRADHPVAQRGMEFIVRSVRADGSWPIDTNLATWVTTLSINALRDDVPVEARPALVDWLVGQQYREIHPYTNAAPGGWAWTDLSGGVPDADDTPGAMLALLALDDIGAILGDESEFDDSDQASAEFLDESDSASANEPEPSPDHPRIVAALDQAVGWLLDLQNSDGGWPTFCRGWGTLPFDRSSPDLTAHVIRALGRWIQFQLLRALQGEVEIEAIQKHPAGKRIQRTISRGFQFLRKVQRPDGAWIPLWFGNQHAADEENPTYGTSRVLAAFVELGEMCEPACQKAVQWLVQAQNSDGGWSGNAGGPSSIEETALATEALLTVKSENPEISGAAQRGIAWLLNRFDAGGLADPSPIGFYFAKLWYFEKLYPVIFATAALRRAVKQFTAR
ncbi:MAG: squalene--hopene cyclase [Planctomycetes bacterium]|nr:squalene--hopene cyclase [Planctomycetota bacterium]